MKACIIGLLLIACYAEGFPAAISSLKDEIESEVELFIKPVVDEAQALMSQVKATKNELISLVSGQQTLAIIGPNKIDFDACADLTIVLETAGELAWNATNDFYTLGTTISDNLWALLNCHISGIDVISFVKCQYSQLENIKKSIDAFKPMFKKYKNEITKLNPLLKEEFQICIGKITPPPAGKPTSEPKSTEHPPSKTTNWWN